MRAVAHAVVASALAACSDNGIDIEVVRHLDLDVIVSPTACPTDDLLCSRGGARLGD